MIDPEEMLSHFNRFASDRLTERLKEDLTEIDPAIDWASVRVIPDFDANMIYFETDSTRIQEQIRVAYAQLKNDYAFMPSVPKPADG